MERDLLDDFRGDEVLCSLLDERRIVERGFEGVEELSRGTECERNS